MKKKGKATPVVSDRESRNQTRFSLNSPSDMTALRAEFNSSPEFTVPEGLSIEERLMLLHHKPDGNSFLPEAQINQNLMEALILIKGISPFRTPAWPYKFEETLRLIANDVHSSWDTLKLAFHQFQWISPPSIQLERDKSELARLTDAVKTTPERFYKLLPSEAYGIDIEHDLHEWKNRQAQLSELIELRANFSPSRSTKQILEKQPKPLITWTVAQSEQDLEAGSILSNSLTLDILTCGFRQFWELHKVAYLKMKTTHRRKPSPEKREVGASTAEKKETRVRLEHVEHYIKSEHLGNVGDDDDCVRARIAAFAGEQTLVKTPEAVANLKEYISSIRHAAIHSISAQNVLETLRHGKTRKLKEMSPKERNSVLKKMGPAHVAAWESGTISSEMLKFKALNVETVERCTLLMREALGLKNMPEPPPSERISHSRPKGSRRKTS